jgi:hypothetical protein
MPVKIPAALKPGLAGGAGCGAGVLVKAGQS